MNVCAKFGDPSSILCQVIVQTKFGIPTDRPTNMSKAIYLHFVEGGIMNAINCKKTVNIFINIEIEASSYNLYESLLILLPGNHTNT